MDKGFEHSKMVLEYFLVSSQSSYNFLCLLQLPSFVVVIAFATTCVVQGFVIFRTYGTDYTAKGLARLGFGSPNWSELISWNQPTEVS
jgi:Na+/glutamate symporter